MASPTRDYLPGRETLTADAVAGTPFGSAELRRQAARRRVHPPEFYYDLLAPCAAHLDAWTSEYLHALRGPNPVLEWITGTSLRPILRSLDDRARETYLDLLLRRLNRAYPAGAGGVTRYPFRRLFFVAVRR